MTILFLSAMLQSPSELTVYIGETTAVDVGYKIGFNCDNTEILRAAMVTRNATNLFVVEGVAPGTTWCRVGTSPGVPSLVFAVQVEERPRP